MLIVLSQTVFFNYFFIVLYYKAFQSINIKRIKGKECLFLVQYRVCSTVSNFLSELSVFAIKKRHFPFFRYHRLVVYEFSHLVSRKSTHKIAIYVRVINIFKSFFYLSSIIPPLIFSCETSSTFSAAFFSASFTTQLATSDSEAFFTFLFLILDVPRRYSSGACFISSSTSFFPVSEFIALAPTPSLF